MVEILDLFNDDERRLLHEKLSKMGQVLQEELHELQDQAVDLNV